jgi:hypothetical protein
MDVPGTQRASFQIAELVEQEQRMITGAGIVPIPDAVFLLAMGRADARIHVEHDASRRTPAMNTVDPLAGQISERRKVPFRREPARLKAAHLARRSRCTRGRLSADYPPHGGIMAQPLGVVHILVSGKSSEHRLSQHSDESMSAILASACVGERITCHRAEAQRVVQFPVCEQACVGGNHRSAKLKHQSAVEIEPESAIIRFTRRVRHDGLIRSEITC